MKKTLVVGMTGPSLHSPAVQVMIEKEFAAIPVFLNQNDPDDLDWMLEKCDFVVLAGGSDWCPTSFPREIDKDFVMGEVVNGENLNKFDIPRDLREIHIMNWAKENGKNILGICRGHQGIGLYHGLYMDLDITGSRVCHQPGAADIKMEGYPSHYVYCVADQKEKFFDHYLTNSFHHQVLPFQFIEMKNFEAAGINALGWSYVNYPTDKSKYGYRNIELMKTVDDLWLSAQWHPELDYTTNKASRIVINRFKEMLLNNGINLPDMAMESIFEEQEFQKEIQSRKESIELVLEQGSSKSKKK